MSDLVVHNWQPSSRMLALIEKNRGRRDLIIDPDTAIFKDVYERKLSGVLSTRTYMCFKRACDRDDYPAKLTWGEFIEAVRGDDEYGSAYLLTIRNFGAKSLDELRRKLL